LHDGADVSCVLRNRNVRDRFAAEHGYGGWHRVKLSGVDLVRITKRQCVVRSPTVSSVPCDSARDSVTRCDFGDTGDRRDLLRREVANASWARYVATRIRRVPELAASVSSPAIEIARVRDRANLLVGGDMIDLDA
jgi:hypothetical protein